MWRVTVYIVTIWLLVQVSARPEISLEDLLERLVTLEDWKRETQKEVATLREIVTQQSATIRNLERDLAIQVNLTASLRSCNEDDKHEDTKEASEEDVYDNVREGHAPANRIRATELHKPIPKNHSTVNKRAIAGGVAFTVFLDHDVDQGVKQTIKFNQIITNDGNGYNINSGIFTCPEAGVYLFSFFIGERSESGARGIYAELIVNSQNVVDAVVDTYHASQDLQGGNMAVVRLSQGDAVWIDTVGAHHVEGSSSLRLTTFTGVYLYA